MILWRLRPRDKKTFPNYFMSCGAQPINWPSFKIGKDRKNFFSFFFLDRPYIGTGLKKINNPYYLGNNVLSVILMWNWQCFSGLEWFTWLGEFLSLFLVAHWWADFPPLLSTLCFVLFISTKKKKKVWAIEMQFKNKYSINHQFGTGQWHPSIRFLLILIRVLGELKLSPTNCRWK